MTSLISRLLADVAERDRKSYDVLGAMQHKYEVDSDEVVALAHARGLLMSKALEAESAVRARAKLKGGPA